MHVRELLYRLPRELIARYPLARRDDARLMVMSATGFDHRHVRDLDVLLPAGALYVVNDTRVLPARLRGAKASTGGKVEVLLVRRQGQDEHTPMEGATAAGAQRWAAMAQSSRPLAVGARITLPPALTALVESRPDDEGLFGLLLFREDGGSVEDAIQAQGHMPLPPYIDREEVPEDRERYQTMFACVPGAVAAPTAGLHFTPELVARLEQRGVVRAAVTLHVGPGTFRPVKVDDLDDHSMHAESFEVSADTASMVASARARGAPVVAVGTTVVRALESAADPKRPGLVRPTRGDTRLLIQPGFRFRIVDALVTNFHLPESTLLALVYAFGGVAPVRAAYRQAIAGGYRFYSYGDAMMLQREHACRP